MSAVVICGGRTFDDAVLMTETIARLPAETVVIHGGAPGADTLAHHVATARGLHIAMVPANWSSFGKSAGPRRNAPMLALQPARVIAFPGGKGTSNCCAQAENLGIPVERVAP